ncbi:heavy metal translocating P-type ATPase [Aureivirga sp. CE67]|uniref:heavy metal translocating P-type ATPase n=1 Tax=Aureivirga sp. CE67 TaxID=1788983 RepID=UPI0018C99ECE|nr:heavy metal translocating P-type ATPase metal-binding domain-containing protein [Aureivirga sp. CE67]
MSKGNCYHCGIEFTTEIIPFDEKKFCCNGCKTVYEILNINNLNCYYDLESAPGTIPTEIKGKYNYLEEPEIISKLVEFDDGDTTVVTLYVPVIHCSSCIWVLENLNKLNEGVKTSIVNFPKKTVRITFKNVEVSLKEIVELITSIGYEPYISLEDADNNKRKVDKTLIYQIAVAAFAFGNVMLLSFPEYFEVEEFWLDKYKVLFRWIMFTMSVPVVFFSAKDYFISAYKGLSHKILNIDIPIALGVFVLFVRSTVEIVFDIGTGFFDSLTGLVFFLLLGKFFQQKTYSFLSFERDYKSYFPIAVTKLNKEKEENILVQDIQIGDRLLIRNEELIPVDGILINGEAMLDYSFVTGESLPVGKNSGDKVFAGGKQTSGAIEMEVLETVSQSYLTQLWSNDVFNKNEGKNIKNITDSISKYFTMAILIISTLAGVFWYLKDPMIAINVVTSILIIACPCALALSAPFALGNMLRIFGKKKFYLKNAEVIEKIAKIDTLVFDKTGTITSNDESKLEYQGAELSSDEKSNIKRLVRSSNHPLSRALYDFIEENTTEKSIVAFEEIVGKGIQGEVDGDFYKIGSASFVDAEKDNSFNTSIYISINNKVKGKFVFKNSYREDVEKVFSSLNKEYDLVILSGDNEGEKNYLKSILPENTKLIFNQKPENKLEYIKSLQKEGKKVMMIGDGLNDAGALAQSNVGISISENINVFSPACDAILDASLFQKLPQFFKLSKKTMSIIVASFIVSFLYNFVGMYFALTGNLIPVVAAILMPLSSITIVVFVTVLTNFFAKNS